MFEHGSAYLIALAALLFGALAVWASIHRYD